MLSRSSEVRARRDGRSAARAETDDGTAAVTVAVVPEYKASDDFAFSVRELPGNGTGLGAGFFAAHWHGPPCEPSRSLQRQWHGPFPQQQHRGRLEDATWPPPQAW